MALAMTGDTWGISGPTFLVAYTLLAVAVAMAGFRARRTIADPKPNRPVTVGDLTARPHDLAYLAGGAERAVYSALTAMHLRGTIVTENGKVSAVGRVEPGDGELERAIHRATPGRVSRWRLAALAGVAGELRRIEQRLVDAGLLLSTEQRQRHRSVAWWMVAVAMLGMLRLLADVAEARPVLFLAGLLAGVCAVVAIQFLRRPRRTRSGDRLLVTMQEQHHDLAPSMQPDWAVYGPAGAALAVGIYGTSAVFASDPAFAAELAVQRGALGSADGGGVAFFGGGDSSGGGGDSSGGGDGGGGGGGGCGGCGG